MAGKYSDACFCRNLTCGIIFLTVGTLCVVAGGIIAAVGFGTRPKDMFDTPNLSMRVAGLCLVGIGILPIIMGTMFLVFYCAYKRGGGLPGQKKPPSHTYIEMPAISKPNIGQNEYPYPKDGGPVVSKPLSVHDDSLMKYDDYDRDGHYSLPLNQSGRLSTDGLVTPPPYSDIKAQAPSATNKTTTTTTTVTKTYKTELLDANAGSSSSGVTFRSETLPEMKAKRKKKKQPLPGNEIAMGSHSSEVQSFDDDNVSPNQKSKYLKKSKRNGPLPSEGDEVFDETDEPLPDGRYRSRGNGGNSRHQQSAQAHHSGTSPSFEQNSDSPPDVTYGKVKKNRNKKV